MGGSPHTGAAWQMHCWPCGLQPYRELGVPAIAQASSPSCMHGRPGAKRRRLEGMAPSVMAESMLLSIGSGGMRPTGAQHLAHSAVLDGIPSEAVAAVASLGNHGRLARKCVARC
jgi:hypothetical protein